MINGVVSKKNIEIYIFIIDMFIISDMIGGV